MKEKSLGGLNREQPVQEKGQTMPAQTFIRK